MSRGRRRPRARAPGDEAAAGASALLAVPLGLTADAVEVWGETLVVFVLPGKQASPAALTPAERAVAELALRGFTTAQIASARRVSKPTVSAQLQSIYRKLGVASRAELACKLG